MDYRVLIEKFFQGTTSHDEEEVLRRYLMEDDLPADILEEKEMLLAMLQPSGYECSEAMEEISAMIDRLAVQEVEHEAAVSPHKPATRMVLMRYVYSVMAVAAVITLLFMVPHYNGNSMQQTDASIVTLVVEEPPTCDSVKLQPVMAEKNAATEEHEDDIDVKGAVPLVTEPENALVANVSKEKTETGEARNIYIGAVNTDAQRIPDYDYSYQGGIDKGLTAMAGIKSGNKNVLKRRNGIYLGGGGGILSEPPIKTDSVLHLSDILAGMEPDHFTNPADAARLVERRDSIRDYSPVVEMLLQAQCDHEIIDNGHIVTEDDVVLAPEDIPWNPASPFQVYGIHNNDEETIVTFAYSICFRSQPILLREGIYAMNDDNGDIYNVLGYVGGYSMEQALVVNGFIGNNILISLRFPKFKRNVRRISIYSPWKQDVIKLANGVDVRKMRTRYRQH